MPSESAPFSLEARQPCVPREKRTVCDFRAPNQSAEFYEIWQHKAGRNIKDTIDFEVSLRKYGHSRKASDKEFRYLNTKVTYNDPTHLYRPDEIKCPKLMGLMKTIDTRYNK